MAPRKNILVIGENVVERKSVINLILGPNVASINDPVRHEPCTVIHFNFTDNYNLIDMMEFNAYSEATTNNQAMLRFVELVEQSLTDGLSLVLFVIRKGRVNLKVAKIYDYFVNTYCQAQVPVVVVITHCEVDYSVDTPAQRRQLEYAGRFWSKKRFADIVSISDANSEQGKQKLKNAIENSSLSVPWRPYNMKLWAIDVLKLAGGLVGGALLVKALIGVILKAGVAIVGLNFFSRLNLNRFFKR